MGYSAKKFSFNLKLIDSFKKYLLSCAYYYNFFIFKQTSFSHLWNEHVLQVLVTDLEHHNLMHSSMCLVLEYLWADMHGPGQSCQGGQSRLNTNVWETLNLAPVAPMLQLIKALIKGNYTYCGRRNEAIWYCGKGQ